MSRLGKQPIALPKGIEINMPKDDLVTVKSAKGLLELKVKSGIKLDIRDNEVEVKIDENSKLTSAFHGLYWALIKNMITGLDIGFKKDLILVGVGYKAQLKGNLLDLQVGYSHPTEIEIPKDISVKVNKATEIEISGSDKQKVGQFASTVRDIRPPEPYKGKGIRYKDEYVRKKAGKAAKTGK